MRSPHSHPFSPHPMHASILIQYPFLQFFSPPNTLLSCSPHKPCWKKCDELCDQRGGGVEGDRPSCTLTSLSKLSQVVKGYTLPCSNHRPLSLTCGFDSFSDCLLVRSVLLKFRVCFFGKPTFFLRFLFLSSFCFPAKTERHGLDRGKFSKHSLERIRVIYNPEWFYTTVV